MSEPDDFSQLLSRKRSGGVKLDAFVSKAIWLGGHRDAQSHEPFVAVGPAEWEGEEELSFFATKADLDQFIGELKKAGREAFGE